MTQREVTEAQPVPRCARGHHARHMLDMRRPSAGGGHFIECRCCQTRKHGTYGDALREWRQKHGIQAPKRPGGAGCQFGLFPPPRVTPVSSRATEAA